MRTAGLDLARLTDLCAEVEYLAARAPLSAHLLPSEGHPSEDGVGTSGVCISVHYAFFTARLRLVIHLLLTSADPAAPLGWQLQVEEVGKAKAQEASACTALVAMDADPVRAKVRPIIDAHATGFGRLRAIHAELLSAFIPP